MSNMLAQPDVLDALMLWRMNDPRYTDMKTYVKGLPMQRQWTIEARADFAEPEKNEAIKAAFRRAAVHINAIMLLLSDGQKPQVVVFSDDYFQGHEDIALIADELGAVFEQHGGEDDSVSSEMMAAAREMKK